MSETCAVCHKGKGPEKCEVCGFSDNGVVYRTNELSTPNIFTDLRDGKIYKIAKIGNQVWMAENLNYDAPGGKCYNNDPANAEKYGRLYDWETAKKVCPAGWHLPSHDEWQILCDFVGGEEIAGKKLKTADFLALPGGFGSSNGHFYSIGCNGGWWSATECNTNYAYIRLMGYNYENVNREYINKGYLFSVRCVQD